MTSASRSLALSALALLAAAHLGARAESSLVSSASDSLSASVGQSSKSIGNSSDSSSKHTDMAQGEYRVVDVAAAAGQPGMVTLTLLPVKDDAGVDRWTLTLPAATVAQHDIAAGQVVAALERPYGMEFDKADAAHGTKTAFFLVMQDDWHRELKSNLVS